MDKTQEGRGKRQSLILTVVVPARFLAEIPAALLQFPSGSYRPQEEKSSLFLFQTEGYAELFWAE